MLQVQGVWAHRREVPEQVRQMLSIRSVVESPKWVESRSGQTAFATFYLVRVGTYRVLKPIDWRLVEIIDPSAP